MPRHGGELRGNSKDRRARKIFLLNTFGDGVKAPCWECLAMVDINTIHVDRIVPGALGGRYIRTNIRVHCKPCSDGQGHRIKARLEDLDA